MPLSRFNTFLIFLTSVLVVLTVQNVYIAQSRTRTEIATSIAYCAEDAAYCTGDEDCCEGSCFDASCVSTTEDREQRDPTQLVEEIDSDVVLE